MNAIDSSKAQNEKRQRTPFEDYKARNLKRGSSQSQNHLRCSTKYPSTALNHSALEWDQKHAVLFAAHNNYA